MRSELKVIASLIKQNSRVLDVGCGEGELLKYLKKHKNIATRGIEIKHDLVSKALTKGLSVIQGDADNDIRNYPADSFDYAILSQTLQATKYPELILQELQRIAKYVIVSVPNFGYIENRLYLAFKGKMPVTKTLAYEWYNTPNIHFCTIKDFIKLAQKLDFAIEEQIFLNDEIKFLPPFKKHSFLANLLAKNGIFLLKRGITISSKTTNSKLHKEVLNPA